MVATQELADRIDAAFSAMEKKRRDFQAEETRKYQVWQQRLEQLNSAFDGLRDVVRPPLELLIKKFGDKVSAQPSVTQSMRSIELEIPSDVARIRLRFQATADHEIHTMILKYDLEIIPILLEFESHSELEMPLDAIDADAVGRWVSERVVAFVNTYISVHENQYYLTEQMVSDPVCGTRFPKIAAGAKLERDGRTYYFVSEAMKREFEKRNSAQAKGPARARE